jgi:type III pantothenate kinase
MMSKPTIKFLPISVGNTRTQFTCIDASDTQSTPDVHSYSNDDVAGLAEEIAKLYARETSAGGRVGLAVASVDPEISEPLIERLEQLCEAMAFRIGTDLPIPIEDSVDDRSKVGVDRLLAALAVYAVTGQAAIVIDAGTAVTVDYIDERGVFQGGAILPGAQLMLSALHGQAALLPEVHYEAPDPQRNAWGSNTEQAMLHGVHDGLCGAIRQLAERYAEQIGTYPQVIATGGDAEVLLGEDPFVDRIVPHLTLLGMAVTCQAALDAGSGTEHGTAET